MSLTVAQLPVHTHIQNAHSHGGGGVNTAAGTPVYQVGQYPIYIYNDHRANWSSLHGINNATPTNQNTGSGTAHNHTQNSHNHTTSTIQPYITVFIYKRIA